MITSGQDNTKKNNETGRKFGEEPHKSTVYWLRKVECKGLEALLMQQEKFAILHMQNFIKATKSGGCVKWTPYAADLDNVHRDGVGKWC
jgi:hypothetical protein